MPEMDHGPPERQIGKSTQPCDRPDRGDGVSHNAPRRRRLAQIIEPSNGGDCAPPSEHGDCKASRNPSGTGPSQDATQENARDREPATARRRHRV